MTEEYKQINDIANRFSGELQEAIASGNKGLALAILDQVRKDTFSFMGSQSSSEKISLSFAITAFTYQIEQECSPQESIKYAAQVHSKDYDQLIKDGTHNRRWWIGDKVAGRIPWFNEQTDNALLPRKKVKESVKNSSTFRKGLGDMSNYQKLDKEIRKMKERLDRLENDSIIKSLSIEHIQDNLDLVQSGKEKAEVLQAKGFTQKEIAKLLGKTDRTVRRWLSKDE